MPSRDSLPSIEPAALAHVTGGTTSSTSSTMMMTFAMMAMMRRRATPKIAPEAAPAPQQAEPPVKLEVNGKEQPLTRGQDGSLSYDNTAQPASTATAQQA